MSQGKAITWGWAQGGCRLCFPKPKGHFSLFPFLFFSLYSLSRIPQFTRSEFSSSKASLAVFGEVGDDKPVLHRKERKQQR